MTVERGADQDPDRFRDLSTPPSTTHQEDGRLFWGTRHFSLPFTTHPPRSALRHPGEFFGPGNGIACFRGSSARLRRAGRAVGEGRAALSLARSAAAATPPPLPRSRTPSMHTPARPPPYSGPTPTAARPPMHGWSPPRPPHLRSACPTSRLSL